MLAWSSLKFINDRSSSITISELLSRNLTSEAFFGDKALQAVSISGSGLRSRLIYAFIHQFFLNLRIYHSFRKNCLLSYFGYRDHISSFIHTVYQEKSLILKQGGKDTDFFTNFFFTNFKTQIWHPLCTAKIQKSSAVRLFVSCFHCFSIGLLVGR